VSDCIELFSFPDSPKRVSRPEARGLCHLAFEISNIDKITTLLASYNIEYELIRTEHSHVKNSPF